MVVAVLKSSMEVTTVHGGGACEIADVIGEGEIPLEVCCSDAMQCFIS